MPRRRDTTRLVSPWDTKWSTSRSRALNISYVSATPCSARSTQQDRLVNELRITGIATVAAANRYLRDEFLPAFNAEFQRPPADPGPAFVPLGRVDLEQILCVEAEPVVGRDNVVVADGVPLQLAKQPGRRTCAGLRVLVRRHLDGHHSVWYGGRCLGHYNPLGQPVRAA